MIDTRKALDGQAMGIILVSGQRLIPKYAVLAARPV
jgi:hypothetical protein